MFGIIKSLSNKIICSFISENNVSFIIKLYKVL